MKTMKIIFPIMWVMVFGYLINMLFAWFNQASTIGGFVSILCIALIICVSYKTRLGLKLITKKQKQNEEIN